MGFLIIIALLCGPLLAAEAWRVRVEEPTGLYRRTDEVVAAPLEKLGAHRQGYRVIDAAGRELASQVASDSLLFPASLVPGELPVYTVTCCEPGARYRSGIVAREVGMRRVELGNGRFRLVIDRGVPAIVEAYSLTAGPQRALNFVETTPDGDRPHPGWTTLAAGELTRVEIPESGPLRARVRLSNATETWEFSFTEASPALTWRVTGGRGFRLAAVSASPYLPFDRFVDGSEYQWPLGPEGGEPPDHQIGPRPWKKPPGGHGVYYRQAENYGTLGIVALDEKLEWSGLGTRLFEATGAADSTAIALTFPEWKGDNTVLEARRENRVLRQPLLATVLGPGDSAARIVTPAAREIDFLATPSRPPEPFSPAALPLDGEWQLASGEKGGGPQSEWRTVRVPGSVHTQILPPTKLFTREAEWISAKEWWYRKRFDLPAQFAGKKLRLQFDSTDYYADAWLNGRYLGRHEGYIDPYEYDVTAAARPGAANELIVRVWTPVSYYWRHRPYTIKGSYGAVDQKPDDITPLGITRSVRLLASEPRTLGEVAVVTRLAGAHAAEVEVTLDAEGPVELTLRPKTFESPEALQIRGRAAGAGSRFVFRVENPRLWWTWDHGRPDLYTLDVRLLDGAAKAIDGRTLTVGIREIEKQGWTFFLNRRRMFIRGTNYYYGHLFLSEMTRAACERDVKLMRGMNVNMIRLHCHFANPEFYDLADEQGILIWQDFLEAWYPHDRAFSLRAAALYDTHIRYVRNHPSVAIWATSDEEDLENYRDLTKHLAPRLFFQDPQRRPVVRSTGRYGDGHIYYGWYGGSIWQYASMNEAFVSELGATALPNYESLLKFLPAHWPIRGHEADWVFHKLQIGEAMRAWGEPGDTPLAEYIPRTQKYVARLFQIALERMRRRKYDSGGILHFHAIDFWPSVTMAAVDFYRVPTKAYDTVRRSFEPVMASLEYDRDNWRVTETVRCGLWVINDLWKEFPGAAVRWRIESAAGLEAEGKYEVTIREDSARRLGDIAWKPRASGAHTLRAEVMDASGARLSENLFEFEVAP